MQIYEIFRKWAGGLHAFFFVPDRHLRCFLWLWHVWVLVVCRHLRG